MHPPLLNVQLFVRHYTSNTPEGMLAGVVRDVEMKLIAVLKWVRLL
jgi:hypothetical protein